MQHGISLFRQRQQPSALTQELISIKSLWLGEQGYFALTSPGKREHILAFFVILEFFFLGWATKPFSRQAWHRNTFNQAFKDTCNSGMIQTFAKLHVRLQLMLSMGCGRAFFMC